MLNRTRRLYQRLVHGAKPDSADIERLIKQSQDYKNLQDTPGWRALEKWIEQQRLGTHVAMERDVNNPSTFTTLTLFNTFIKYIFRLLENRTYIKIETYMRVTIQRGEHYAKQKQAAERQQSSK